MDNILASDPRAYEMDPPDWDSSIDAMSKRGEYEQAIASGRKPIVPSGDFWHWLGETYPAQKNEAPANHSRSLNSSAPAKSTSQNNDPWDDVVAKMNAARGVPAPATKQSQAAPLTATSTSKPTQKGAVPWDDIADELNAKKGH